MRTVDHNRAVVEDPAPKGLLNADRGNTLKSGFGLSDVEKSLFSYYFVGIELNDRALGQNYFANLHYKRNNEPEKK